MIYLTIWLLALTVHWIYTVWKQGKVNKQLVLEMNSNVLNMNIFQDVVIGKFDKQEHALEDLKKAYTYQTEELKDVWKDSEELRTSLEDWKELSNKEKRFHEGMDEHLRPKMFPIFPKEGDMEVMCMHGVKEIIKNGTGTFCRICAIERKNERLERLKLPEPKIQEKDLDLNWIKNLGKKPEPKGKANKKKV